MTKLSEEERIKLIDTHKIFHNFGISTYILEEDKIYCKCCEKASYEQKNIENLYCPFCEVHHDNRKGDLFLQTWTCMICNRRRLDKNISVWQIDRSKEYNQSPNSITENVRYCNDNKSCFNRAKQKKFKPEVPLSMRQYERTI